VLQLDTAFPFQQDELADGIIVVVEDDLDTALMLREVIEAGTPYQALLLQTPGEALQHLEALAKLKPALFLLDYDLPQMTGVELYDRLHAHQQLASVPAFFLSAVKENGSFKQALAARHVEVLEKP
jgi:CheY-like chemotaxis protein